MIILNDAYLTLFQNKHLKKTAEATGDLICNNIANKVSVANLLNRTIQKKLQMNITNKYQKKDRPEGRQKIIDDIRLI